ncbi:MULTISPECIES: glycine zipper family protein [unclassified Photobacterium]|uniref:glycine zipper family protein n=1 Tax=unclassified Photobacterium TaxID=2628852 RepID=UPI000D16A694|nr:MULTISPECIES: glycine zipper family protein [unclassified Photobacterium]PSV27457.1 glycine zipper family protein [Photobacterium sp. GB-56]PSV31236.1 glycine zipper family protein [Photobacterium sp. GB-72]PSV34745.1 glycine zipper family protein [Photobacterium sp. GB-210]PSV37130.1 glycine zipper family protein [Photobacterium sp. GB-27]PSV53691.1 glycine zipper family protein [Photobacterium sp. GB-1]
MSTKFKALIPVLFVSTLSACSAPMTPVDKELVVDMNGVDTAQYQKDYDYCNHFADSVSTPEMTSATKKRDVVIGTLAGATAFGAGAYDSDNYDTIKHPGVVTALGAVVGAAGGYVAGSNEASKDEKHKKSSVLRQCLLQKGYHVYDIS